MDARRNIVGLTDGTDFPTSVGSESRREVHCAVGLDDDSNVTSTSTVGATPQKKTIRMHGIMGVWPPPAGTPCYHDGEAFEGEPVPLPEYVTKDGAQAPSYPYARL